MDRARRTTANRRRPQAASASPQSNSDASLDHQLSASPVMAHAITNTPQTAPQGRRANKTQQQSFTFSTPGPARALNSRKRSKTMDDYAVPEDEDENGSPRKGGHSLRKRARVDYTFEQVDDDVELSISAPASSSRSSINNSSSTISSGSNSTSNNNNNNNTNNTNNNKKRKSDNGYDSDDDVYGPALKRRGTPVDDADTPSSSSRRRNPARKTSEIRAYKEEADEDENDVQDTIEVGVSFSDPGKSDVAEAEHSNLSLAEQPTETSEKPPTPTHSQLDMDSANANRAADDSVEEPVEKDSDSRVTEVPVGDSHDEQLSQETNDNHPDNLSSSRKSSTEPQPQTQQDVNSAEEDLSSSRASEPPHDAPQSPKPEAGEPEVREPTPSPASPAATDSLGDEKQDGPVEVHREPSAQVLEDGGTQNEPEVAHDPEEGHQEEEGHQSPEPEPDSVPCEPCDAPVLIVASVQLNFPRPQDDASQDGDIDASKTDASATITITNGTVESPSSLAPEAALPDIQDQDDSQATTSETKFTDPTSVTGDDIVSSPTVPSLDTFAPAVDQAVSEPSRTVLPRPQPRPAGRWAHLTPYVDGEYATYPEKKSQPEDEAGISEEQTPEDKDVDRYDMDPMDENDDMPDPTALNTPTRGSPVPDSIDPTAANSPAAAGDDMDEVDVAEAQEPPERRRYYRYRKLRNADEYISAIENYENMSTPDLYELLDSINLSLVEWQNEWNGLGKIVDDYENSLRRRVADIKYESRTRSFHQHGVNYEEPDFAVKGYKAKDKEAMNETRYLQAQDRIMAAAYGFEYDPHPSKIGRQNPETQQVGIMTRGRSLRNQPKPTAKATEADEVTGKRQRKPVQLFELATQDVSRSSTPVPTRGRRRKNANAENEDMPLAATSSFNGEPPSDGEGTERMRRRRGPRPRTAVPSIVEDAAPTPVEESSVRETPTRSGRRGRGKQPVKYEDEPFPLQFIEDEDEAETKQPKRRHLLTLKIPKGKNFSEPSSAIPDNGDSRPSTASSDSTSHTAESSYSFRPKRQKRFRDDPEEGEDFDQAPPKKRAKRGDETAAPAEQVAPEAPQNAGYRKIQKIKVVRAAPANRKGTPSTVPNGEGGEEPQKDYKSMTKSEKMSASMKSRWANGNMAGAVEKRKATLAAKKAAQAAAEQKVGPIAPKPKATKSSKRDAAEQGQQASGAFTQTTLSGMGFPFPAA